MNFFLDSYLLRSLFATLAYFFLFSLSLHAESYTINEALALTLLKNPQLHSYSYDMRAAEAQRLQAGFYPNPVLDIETENINTPIFGQTTFMLSQLIEMGGKRDARLQLARSEKDRIFLDYDVMKRQLFVETTLLFIDALINQQKLIFLEENLKNIERFASVVQKRMESGKASIIEESNFNVLLNTARIDLANAQNELKKAKNKLAAQWSEPNNDTFFITGSLDWIPEVMPLENLGYLIQDHPEVLRSYFEDNVRSAKINVEKSKAIPDFNVRGGPRYLNEAKKWVWCVGFSVPLPIHDRNQGNIFSAYENRVKLDTEREALWIKLLTELNNTYSTLETLFFELSLLKNSILPSAQKAYDFSYKGYESARYNYLELIETERSYRTSRIRFLQAIGDYHKALAVLQGLTGSKAITNQNCE